MVLSLTAWLISLSLMLSSYIHAVAKGISSFLLLKTKFSILLFEIHLHKLNDPVNWPSLAGGEGGWEKGKTPGYQELRVPQNH